MESKTFVMDIREILTQFLLDLQPVSDHSYCISTLINMVVETACIAPHEQLLTLSRFCMGFSIDPVHSVNDAQIMSTAIMNFRNDLFRLFNLYGIVIMNDVGIDFPYHIQFKQFKDPNLYVQITPIQGL